MVTGKGTISGFPAVIAIMDSTFRMGSMGSVVGEKSRLQLKSKRGKSPFIIFTASGGARMQEGLKSYANGKDKLCIKTVQ